jgi:hypothetical protein
MHYIFFLFSISLGILSAHGPIDVIIPCHSKDYATLELCIKGIKDNCIDAGRIFVVSDKQITDSALWISEDDYPFSYSDVYTILQSLTTQFTLGAQKRVGWYYQQLLKFYAPFVIPDLSEDYLIVDADTVFLKPTKFINSKGYALYNTSGECHMPYFEHAKKFVPGFQKIFPEYSGVCHHMLLQKNVIFDLFNEIESFHNMPFWKAFYSLVDKKDLDGGAGASEYEIYFNFIFSQDYKVKIRKLKWTNISNINMLNHYRSLNYNYVSCHAHLRD